MYGFMHLCIFTCVFVFVCLFVCFFELVSPFWEEQSQRKIDSLLLFSVNSTKWSLISRHSCTESRYNSTFLLRLCCGLISKLLSSFNGSCGLCSFSPNPVDTVVVKRV